MSSCDVIIIIYNVSSLSLTVVDIVGILLAHHPNMTTHCAIMITKQPSVYTTYRHTMYVRSVHVQYE